MKMYSSESACKKKASSVENQYKRAKDAIAVIEFGEGIKSSGNVELGRV
jgi:hypothetical protein